MDAEPHSASRRLVMLLQTHVLLLSYHSTKKWSITNIFIYFYYTKYLLFQFETICLLYTLYTSTTKPSHSKNS